MGKHRRVSCSRNALVKGELLMIIAGGGRRIEAVIEDTRPSYEKLVNAEIRIAAHFPASCPRSLGSGPLLKVGREVTLERSPDSHRHESTRQRRGR